MKPPSKQTLDEWATSAKNMAAVELGITGKERSEFLASTIGSQAFRIGLTEEEISDWLSRNYGKVFVGVDLNPGLDAKDIRKLLLKSYNSARSKQEADQPTPDVVLQFLSSGSLQQYLP